MTCRSCKHISHTRGEAAIGRAAASTCGFCGHQTLIPLHYPSSITKARASRLGRPRDCSFFIEVEAADPSRSKR
jgi:hypothetical protein